MSYDVFPFHPPGSDLDLTDGISASKQTSTLSLCLPLGASHSMLWLPIAPHQTTSHAVYELNWLSAGASSRAL